MEEAEHPIDEASGYSGERLAPRTNLFLMATVVIGGTIRPVRIRNMSVNGALIETINLPLGGTPLTLRRGRLSADAVLMWADEHRGGISFNSPIALSDWLPFGPGLSHGQARVDSVLADTRDQLAARHPAAARPAVDEPLVRRHVGSAVADIARRVERVTAKLAIDGIAEDKLHEIEAAAKALRGLERLLSLEDDADVIASIHLDELRRRMEQRHSSA